MRTKEIHLSRWNPKCLWIYTNFHDMESIFDAIRIGFAVPFILTLPLWMVIIPLALMIAGAMLFGAIFMWPVFLAKSYNETMYYLIYIPYLPLAAFIIVKGVQLYNYIDDKWNEDTGYSGEIRIERIIK